MAKTQVQKNWTPVPNIRYPMATAGYNGFSLMTAWFMYQLKIAAVAAGWTLKWSSNGAAGPANAGDHTDRIAYVPTVTTATRGGAAAAAQSWMVLENVDGIQMLIAYQGAFDDDVRTSFSYAGFTLAGTTTFQPTAADEVVLLPAAAGATMFEGSGAIDRVMSIGVTNESIFWAIYSAGTLRNILGVEKFDSACDSIVLPKAYCGYHYWTIGDLARTSNPGSVMGGTNANAVGTVSWGGCAMGVTTGGAYRIVRIGGGDISIPNGTGSSAGVSTAGGVTNTDKPALQNLNAAPLLEINWFGEKAANLDGYVGKPIDWWFGVMSANTKPNAGDVFSALAYNDDPATAPVRANWLMAFGPAFVRPWLNSDPAGLVTG